MSEIEILEMLKKHESSFRNDYTQEYVYCLDSLDYKEFIKELLLKFNQKKS
jgi:hypothetical protein